MFGEITYYQEESPGFFKPANTFSSMFNTNSGHGQLECEMTALAGSFRAVIPEFDFYVTLGNFFWSIGAGRCVVAAYKLAKRFGALPDYAAARLNAIQKSPFRDKTVVITGDLFRMERPEALFEVRKRGGLTSDNPVNTMDILVLGSQEWSEMNGGVASRKVQKAVDLQKKGRKIAIISEDDFYSMLNE